MIHLLNMYTVYLFYHLIHNKNEYVLLYMDCQAIYAMVISDM